MTSSRSTVRISLRMTRHDFELLQHNAQLAKLSPQAYLIHCGRGDPERLSDTQRRRLHKRGMLAVASPEDVANVNKIQHWQIRVPPSVKDELKSLAKMHRHSLSDYLVRRGCHRPLSTPVDPNWLQAKHQIARLSNNATQICRVFYPANQPTKGSSLAILLGAIKQLSQRLREAGRPFDDAWIEALVQHGREVNDIAIGAHGHGQVLTMRLRRVANSIEALAMQP